MAKELVRIFSPETYAGGGGSLFNSGLYRLDENRFVKYDFNGKFPGKNGDGTTCLCVKYQPVDKDGKDAGEVNVQYYGVGEDIVIENKGKAISMAEGSQFDTIWPKCDFAVFIDHLGKAKFDRDAYEEENDISVLDGTVAECGMITHPYKSPTISKKNGKEYPAQLPVVIQVQSGNGSSRSAGSKATGSKAASAPAGKFKVLALDPDELLQEYLVSNVLIEKNEKKGVDKLQARMGLNKFVQSKGGDADTVKAVSAQFNKTDDVLIPLLESANWTLEGSTIKPQA